MMCLKSEYECGATGMCSVSLRPKSAFAETSSLSAAELNDTEVASPSKSRLPPIGWLSLSTLPRGFRESAMLGMESSLPNRHRPSNQVEGGGRGIHMQSG